MNGVFLELEPVVKDVLYRGQKTTVELITHLYEQNASVMAVVGCLAAIATGTLGVHIAKKKREWVSKSVDNLSLMPSNIIYNYPIFGHSLGFPTDPVEFWDKIGEAYKYFKRTAPDQAFAIAMFGPWQMVIPMKPEATEHVFRSQVNISKGVFYNFFLPWLNTGLLTSTGHKWKNRRRLLTPAFHKHVLEDYLEAMNEKADIMIDLVKAGIKRGEKKIEVQHFITLCALDIIVETAMGAKSDLQSVGEQHEYVQAIYDVMSIIQKRQKSVWLWPDFVFKSTADGQKYQTALKILHDFTRGVISDRWTDYKKKKEELGEAFESEYFGEAKSSRKHRLSFLDTLLQAMDKGDIDMDGCCEEVDTFMFEGHDTTSAAMTWTIQEIGNNPKVLERCLEEVDTVFGDSNRPASIEDLNKLKYMDACIKEALRKFPSVPIFARELDEDQPVSIDNKNYMLRKGSLFVIPDYFLHRDERHWPEPEQFRPERFLDGAADRRYAYSYTPFSAGSRNCIGQKFAILEEKVLVSKMLRNFRWKSQRETNTIPIIAEIITRPKGGCYIEVEARK